MNNTKINNKIKPTEQNAKKQHESEASPFESLWVALPLLIMGIISIVMGIADWTYHIWNVFGGGLFWGGIFLAFLGKSLLDDIEKHSNQD